MAGSVTITPADSSDAEVRALLTAHFHLAQSASPPEDVHALDPNEETGTGVSFYALHDDGRMATIGALRPLDDLHVEIKSMHTAHWARGRGFGRALLKHLIAEAEAGGFERVSLETGTMAEFATARALYLSEGFEVCPPFGEYFDSPNSVCMTRALTGS